MVAVERQAHNRQRTISEGLRDLDGASDKSGGEDV